MELTTKEPGMPMHIIADSDALMIPNCTSARAVKEKVVCRFKDPRAALAVRFFEVAN